MNIAIIGANGNVGTELSLLLHKEKNIRTYPIVRNILGKAFLHAAGLPCRVAEITQESDAQTALHDIDVAVLAAYVWPDFSLSAQQNKQQNKQLIINTVRFTKRDAKLIYFSSIRAFSRAIDPETSFIKPLYDKEKRSLERFFYRTCHRFHKRGYVFRLGHVFGKYQPLTRKINELTQHTTVLTLQTSPQTVANVLHTVTLAEAILLCSSAQIPQKTYTLVNQPQWTWDDVFCYYAPSSLKIHWQEKKPQPQTFHLFLSFFSQFFQKYYARLRALLPVSLDRRIQDRYRIKKMQEEIARLETGTTPVYLEAFRYNPAPGPFFPRLTTTQELLQRKYF